MGVSSMRTERSLRETTPLSILIPYIFTIKLEPVVMVRLRWYVAAIGKKNGTGRHASQEDL